MGVGGLETLVIMCTLELGAGGRKGGVDLG